MTPTAQFEVIWTIALVLFLQHTNVQKKQQVSSRLETVSLCELTKDWRKYDHRTVRIEAIYSAGNEPSEVYDSACPTSDHTAWAAPWPYGSPSPVPAGLQRRLSELLKLSGRARITAVGEFDGPKGVDPPPGLSQEAGAEFMRRENAYGHMNHWKFQFVFSRIEDVEPVRPDTPWPTWADQKKQ